MAYEGQTCRRVGPLTERRRDNLPDKAFGLPASRKYPMPDPQHAANAKGRAKQALDKGDLTRKQYKQIVRKADRVIESCKGPSLGDWNAPRRGAAVRKQQSMVGPFLLLAGGIGIVVLSSMARQR